MVTVLVEIEVKPGHEAAFVEAARVNLAERRAAPGCEQVDLYQSAVDPTLFTLIETFASQAALDAYYASPAHAQWMASIGPMVASMAGADQHRI